MKPRRRFPASCSDRAPWILSPSGNWRETGRIAWTLRPPTHPWSASGSCESVWKASSGCIPSPPGFRRWPWTMLGPLDLAAAEKSLDALSAEVNGIRERQKTAQEEVVRLQEMRRQLELFDDLRKPSGLGSAYSFLVVRTGLVSSTRIPQLEESLESLPSILVPSASAEGPAVGVLLVTLKRDDGGVEPILARAGWEDRILPPEARDDKEEALRGLDARVSALRIRQSELQSELDASFSGKAEIPLQALGRPPCQRASCPRAVRFFPYGPYRAFFRLDSQGTPGSRGRGHTKGGGGEMLHGMVFPGRGRGEKPEGAGDHAQPGGPEALRDACSQLRRAGIRHRGPHPLRRRGLPGHVRTDVRGRGARPGAGPSGNGGYPQGPEQESGRHPFPADPLLRVLGHRQRERSSAPTSATPGCRPCGSTITASLRGVRKREAGLCAASTTSSESRSGSGLP